MAETILSKNGPIILGFLCLFAVTVILGVQVQFVLVACGIATLHVFRKSGSRLAESGSLQEVLNTEVELLNQHKEKLTETMNKLALIHESTAKSQMAKDLVILEEQVSALKMARRLDVEIQTKRHKKELEILSKREEAADEAQRAECAKVLESARRKVETEKRNAQHEYEETMNALQAKIKQHQKYESKRVSTALNK